MRGLGLLDGTTGKRPWGQGSTRGVWELIDMARRFVFGARTTWSSRRK